MDSTEESASGQGLEFLSHGGRTETRSETLWALLTTRVPHRDPCSHGLLGVLIGVPCFQEAASGPKPRPPSAPREKAPVACSSPAFRSQLWGPGVGAWPSPPAASASSAPSAPGAPGLAGSDSRPSAPGTGGSARGLKRKAGHATGKARRQSREPHGAGASSAKGLTQDNSKAGLLELRAGQPSGLLRAPVRGDGRGASRLGGEKNALFAFRPPIPQMATRPLLRLPTIVFPCSP